MKITNLTIDFKSLPNVNLVMSDANISIGVIIHDEFLTAVVAAIATETDIHVVHGTEYKYLNFKNKAYGVFRIPIIETDA